jgi:hypothetical protein
VVHPLAYGRALAAEIGGAVFSEITSKVESKARYIEEFRFALKSFLDDCAAGNLHARMTPAQHQAATDVFIPPMS